MKPHLRVVMTTDAVGGVWRYSLDAACALKARGVEVLLVGLGPTPDTARRDEAVSRGLQLDWLGAGLDWMANDANEVQHAGRTLNAWIARRGPDLVHLNSPALLPFIEPDRPRLAVTHSCLTTWWAAVRKTPLPEDWHWHRRLTWSGLAMADLAVAPSRAFADQTQRAYGALPNLLAIPNACEPVAARDKEAVILAAGRWWDESKNIAALDEAAAMSDWPVLAAGPLCGPQGQAVSPQHVDRIGELSAGRMRDRLARCAVFASLSIYEPFGLAVLEAASAGAALVLSDIPTFRELWEGCAIFTDPHRPAAAADAFNRLAAYAELRTRLGTAAAKRAAAYSPAAQARALADAYRSLNVRRPEAV